MAERIPQRELRNQIGSVLRRAEQGERFTITVSGRAVAELGPLSGARELAPAERLKAIFEATPVDPGWVDEVRRMREEDRAVARDPWRS